MDCKILVKWCFADVYEDSYEEGELDQVNSWDMSGFVGKTYNSIEELVKKLSSWGFSDNVKDYGFFEDNGGELLNDIYVDEDGVTADKRDIEAWKNGELKLYDARLSCGVTLIKEVPMTDKDAKELGLAIY